MATGPETTSKIVLKQENKKEEAFKELQSLKCPKLGIEGERIRVYGEKVSMDSARQFNEYVQKSIDKRGQEFADAINRGTEQIARDMGLGRTTRREAVEASRERQELETALRAHSRRKTDMEIEEEERREKREYADNVHLEKRQDMASRGESDGGVLGGQEKDPASVEEDDLDGEGVVDQNQDIWRPKFDDSEE